MTTQGKTEEKSAIVKEFDEEGNRAGGKVVDFPVIDHIVHNTRGKFMIAAMAWWKYRGQLRNFEWDIMQCEPAGESVFMVHEGRDGNHELVSYNVETEEFSIFGDLECEMIIGTVRLL